MKKILLIALLLTLASGTAIAQKQHGFGDSSGGANKSVGGSNPVERLTERLGLSADQAAEIAVIFETTQMLRDEEREESRQIACELRDSTHLQVLEVLTPEQEALYLEQQQQRAELRQAIEEARGDRGYGGRGMMNCDG